MIKWLSRLRPSPAQERIPVIVCLQDQVSGVISWAFRLQKAFEDHPKYAIRLLYTGKNMEPPSLGPTDAYTATQDDVREFLAQLGRAVIVPNWLFYVIPICADLIARGQDLRLIGFCRADSDSEYYNPLDWFEPLLARFAAVSPECARKLALRIPKRHDDIETMPTGVFVPKSLKRDWRNDPVRIIYAGRVSQTQKRAMDFVPLAEELLRANVNFVFDIVGDGDALEPLREAFSNVPHDGRVRFGGRVAPDEVPALWASHDIYIQTSEYEGTSNSMLESMAQGAAPVVTRIESGVDGIVEEGKNGFLVPVGDMKAMAERIRTLASDPTDLERIGRAAHETSKRFSMEAYVTKFANILDLAVSGPIRKWPKGREPIPEGGYYEYNPAKDNIG